MTNLHTSDIIKLDHAVVTLSKSLRTILDLCPELLETDINSLGQENEEMANLFSKGRLSLVKSVKQAYNEGKFAFADHVFAANQINRPTTTLDFEELITADTFADSTTVDVQEKMADLQTSLSNASTKDTAEVRRRRSSPRVWPPPLPQINNADLRTRVFTHKSMTSEFQLNNHELVNTHNERLEFLGDAVLNFVMGQHVYNEFPDAHEGELSSMRASLVCNDTLGKWAAVYNLHKRLKTKVHMTQEQEDAGQIPKSIADVFEAYVGGVLLDEGNGMKTVCSWLIDLVEPYIVEIGNQRQESVPINKDAKNILYALIGSAEAGPEYVILEEGDSLSPFRVECVFKDKVLGTGVGGNLRIAGIRAAMSALERKDVIDKLIEERRRNYDVSSYLRDGTGNNTEVDSPEILKKRQKADDPKSRAKKKPKLKLQRLHDSLNPKDVLYSVIGSAESRPSYKASGKGRNFTASVYMHSELLGQGKGSSRREAELNAAQDSLDNNLDTLRKFARNRALFDSM